MSNRGDFTQRVNMHVRELDSGRLDSIQKQSVMFRVKGDEGAVRVREGPGLRDDDARRRDDYLITSTKPRTVAAGSVPLTLTFY